MYRPSQLAASAVIISINIYRRDQEKFEKRGAYTEGGSPRANDDSFFAISPTKGPNGEGQLLLNTDLWNNSRVSAISGYSIEMIKEPLYELSIFIR